MARYLLQSTRPLLRVARNNIEIFATLGAIAAGALVPLPSPSERGGGAAHGGFSVAYDDARSDSTVDADDSDSSSSTARSSRAHSNSGQLRR